MIAKTQDHLDPMAAGVHVSTPAQHEQLPLADWRVPEFPLQKLA